MFHKIYVVVCVAKFADGEVAHFTTVLNHKDIAENLVQDHKRTFGNEIIHCGLTEHEIWIG